MSKKQNKTKNYDKQLKKETQKKYYFIEDTKNNKYTNLFSLVKRKIDKVRQKKKEYI